MKSFIVVTLILFVSIASGQISKQTNLVEKFKKLDQLKEKRSDSLVHANASFKKDLIRYLNDNPSSITQNMDFLSKAGVFVATSNDNLFRVYSWDDMMGGALRSYQSVVHYKINEISYVREQLHNNEFEECLTDTVYTLKNEEGNVWYLCSQQAKSSNHKIYKGIAIYSFDRNTFDVSAKIIKDEEFLRNEIGITVDVLKDSDTVDGELLPKMYFDGKRNEIIISPVYESGIIKEEKKVYEFVGGLFVKSE